jgi:thioredoxin-dependent peroxiredoxin
VNGKSARARARHADAAGTAGRDRRRSGYDGRHARGPELSASPGSVSGMTKLAHGNLKPGDIAPDFDLPTDDGSKLSLSGLRGNKVILYAYPAAMTPGCTKQACDFRDSLASLTASGYKVVGISPDKPEKLAKFRERDMLTFPLVSDVDKSVLAAYGAYGEKQLYGKTVTGVIRSTFVIDEQGHIEHAFYNVKATGHVAKLRRDLGLD